MDSENLKGHTFHACIEQMRMLIDKIVTIAIAKNALSTFVNAAPDEHDEPYYVMDNRYPINIPFHTFKGTDKVYGVATLESVKNSERLTLSIMKKDQLDGINNALEVDHLLKHAICLIITINIVLMESGYLG